MEKLIDTQAIVSQATAARHSHHTVVIFGEVLFDDFPDGAVLGGAPFNVAWHLQAFGLHPVMISRTGNDAQRDQIIGQSICLPPMMGLIALASVITTSATVVIYGSAIWDPVALSGKLAGPFVLLGLVVISIDTI